MEFLQELVGDVRSLGDAGYWLLLAVTFGESFILSGVFVPGTIVLLIMGGLSSYGYYNPTLLACSGFIGAALGNAVSYEIGRLGKVHIERHHAVNTLYGRAKKYFAIHGGKSILLCRFIGPIRPIVPFIAGAMGMNRLLFYGYTFLGGFVWIVTYLSFGYAFGYAWKSAATWSSIAVAAALILIIGVLILWRWLRVRA